MIKAGIFDVGGVLIHYNSNAPIEKDIQTTLGISESIFRKAWDSLHSSLSRGEIDEGKFWELFLSWVKRDKKSLPEKSLLEREFESLFSPNQDVLNLVHTIKHNGCKLAVLSNTIVPHVAFLEKNGIYDDFDIRIFSNEAGVEKPDPAIYKAALVRLGVNPEESFFTDDAENNVSGAKRLGINGILFKNVDQLISELTDLGVKI